MGWRVWTIFTANSDHSGDEGNIVPTKILIADDDPDTVLLVRRLLEPEGYQVIAAQDGAEALQFVAKERPKVVLLDIKLPKINGFEVCERIKANETYRGTVVIMLTALAFPWNRERGLQAGADHYVAKPFAVVELRALIRKVSGV